MQVLTLTLIQKNPVDEETAVVHGSLVRMLRKQADADKLLVPCPYLSHETNDLLCNPAVMLSLPSSALLSTPLLCPAPAHIQARAPAPPASLPSTSSNRVHPNIPSLSPTQDQSHPALLHPQVTLQSGAAQCPLDFADSVHRRTLLHWASLHGRLNVVTFLCENGVPIGAPDANSRSPLVLSLTRNFGGPHVAVAEKLVEHGALPAPDSPEAGELLLEIAGRTLTSATQLLLSLILLLMIANPARAPIRRQLSLTPTLTPISINPAPLL